ncbi:MAG: VanZ family protein [Pirellulales bacterium]|nr:VanZ family protein [Pirellulales bacterium]
MAILVGLFACACAAVVYVLARRLTRGSKVSVNHDITGPSCPSRYHYFLLALFFTAIAIYGSLVPLRFTPLAWGDAVTRFREIPYLTLGAGRRADWVANILLFIPISYCWLATLVVDRRAVGRRVLTVPLVVALATVMSFVLEFTQLWFPPRTVSRNDILAETIGAVLGTVLWLLIGQTLTDWIRTYTTARRPKDQIDWLLELYFLGLMVYSVMPLDLTISVGELTDKYQAGRIELVPFADFTFGFASLFGLFRDVVVFVPIGMLATTWFTRAERLVRSLGRSVWLGAAFVLATEFAQLFVYSRYVSTSDVISGILGVWLGVVLMRRWRGGVADDQRRPASNRSAGRSAWYLGLAAVYVVFLGVLFCAPYVLIDDPQEIKARYQGFFAVPFAAMYHGSEFNAISDILKKLLLYMPLGALSALAVANLPVPRQIRRLARAVLLLVAAGVATSIEMAQVFLPPHYPDITDVILCTAGAAVGMFVTARIVDARA